MNGRSGRKDAVEIGYLGDHPEAIPVIARWIYDEWSFLYPGKTARYLESLLRKRLNKKGLPFTLVAREAGKPVGTVSLKAHDMQTRRKLTPWLTSLYVVEPARKRGIGSRLVTAAEREAAALKIPALYLVTVGDDLVRFYLQRGWSIREEMPSDGYTVVIMQKGLQGTRS